MSVNSSSSNSPLPLDSPLNPGVFSINASIPLHLLCLLSSKGSFIFISYNITSIILVLPLCIFILHHGLQQWCSTSSAATMSHSDIFTYHMVIMELIRVFVCTLACFGIYKENFTVLFLGFCLLIFPWYGEILFHILTCVEHYLAVVHPITYLSLRKERGIRFRNVTTWCVWLLCCAGMGLIFVEHFTTLIFLILIFSLIIISFCSLSVLWVLTHSGPGAQVGRRENVDQSKLRAFYTIMAILGVLVLKLTWGIIWSILHLSGNGDGCVIKLCEIWFNLPSCLVLPLLFLHRTGNLRCCNNNVQKI